MKSLIINMSLGTVEQDHAGEAEYSDEVLYAGWIPSVALLQPVPELRRKTMPSELATVDAELFLQKMETWKN